ncbi:MAG TPA: ABC transporter ATP-binding protein, partial [Gammaproteobacteria bacterium]|nr:ABC transporter ATP-binding protein [Gammaproteobacteria bacterium]
MNDAHTLQAAHADTVIDVRGLDKIYAGGFQALKNINLTVRRGEIFALLGPNGAGKTTLISIICGIVNPGRGSITVEGHDVVREWRATRSIVGLVPQELKTDAFESVWNTVRFSRGLFNKAPDDAYIEQLLKDLTLWEKRSNKVMMLSGGMKRRVMIAKALSHQPRVLFLDEPSAGVDVELRRDMWAMVRRLRESGVTIILTTHYIEEAEDMADRVGVINRGELVVVEDTATLMHKLGKKQLRLQLHEPLAALPATLSAYNLALNGKGDELIYTYDTQSERTGITPLLRDLAAAGIGF